MGYLRVFASYLLYCIFGGICFCGFLFIYFFLYLSLLPFCCLYPLVGSFLFVHPIFSCPADHVQYSTVQYRIDNRVVEARSVKRTHTHTHIHTSLIPSWENQCEWHTMTRMTGPDCAIMYHLINTYTHIQTHTVSIVLFCKLLDTWSIG